MSERILVVEDEPGISSFLEKGLRAADYDVTIVDRGREAIRQIIDHAYDLMLLDIGLPDIDGFEVLEHVRGQGYQLPIIVLTARTSVDDTVQGLNQGADDYVPKPFRLEELIARIRLQLRKASGSVDSDDVLEAGDIRLELRTHRVFVADEAVELTPREFTMLQAFIEHPGQVLTRTQLLDLVWGFDYDPGSNVVDVYVRYLRLKIGMKRIVTVRGIGYRLDLD
ncbi:response regulator transcription factor [Nanchangia anserum]|uniref:Response regulator transcription factor n=1 Tax=Nanchangia anserum TaxID=2692125 RepID=A0A8I0GAN7_9ACTO|nr:response regulator transcription factor [Nanchangia anserum]MBD3689308.1 response regulator transcription factor [Nanchangia anserum]QOX81523.1 response regulator transcription factor [Nanchangia anserum]